ncbi:hypothetical protein [Pseudomonas sp.]|uniref:hypothetical protein n=1 Tax=Pseudomonas sp. TaxID=306 RepID=UPI00299EFC76|nr:hypothetical protein [Pseudomonas sp.]MDX1370155.1 hypothetical protein [Pseudomonas sp.]
MLKSIGLLLSLALVSGCVVQTTYSKTVTVTKDPDGRVLSIVESETVVQPAQGYPIKLQLVKGVQP